MRVIVIGAGISGLACASRLAERGADVTVLESSQRVGGVIATSARNGFLFELGPQSFQLTPSLVELLRSAGLEAERVAAPRRAPRFVLAGGRLRPVPIGPQILVSGSLLGFSTRARLLRDLLAHSRPPDREESLAEFVHRKFGAEFLDRLAGPFASGIYAGDPARLGLRDTFPDLYRWEKERGSVLRGAIRAMRGRRARGGVSGELSSLRRGNASLPEALAAKLGSRIQLGAGAASVERAGTPCACGFGIEVHAPAGASLLVTDHVVVATPADGAARLLGALSPRLAELLLRIEYAPVAVVGLGYRREQVRSPLDGFGFLVARSEGLKLLGTVWTSSLFPARAPEGRVSLASFLGGATDPSTTELPPDRIAGILERELAPILGISGSPIERMVNVHPRALPQYNLGHRALVEEIRAEVDRFPGLHLVGNYLQGPSTGMCAELAFRLADGLMAEGKNRPPSGA